LREIGVISDFELAKLMMDPKRSSILAAAAEPVTVKQIADKLGEVPSRLYYHVKKLEDANLLRVVETKQQGNLIERYYQTTVQRHAAFKMDEQMLSENAGFFIQWLHNLLKSGMTVLEKNMELGDKNDESLHVDATIHYAKLTRTEWVERHEAFIEINGKDRVSRATEPKDNDDAKSEADSTTKQTEAADLDEKFEKAGNGDEDKDDYVFILMSYRLSDAEKLVGKQSEDTEEMEQPEVTEY